jgi:hypothetical protein
MPRTFDGPIPERPARNALEDRITDLFDLTLSPRPHNGQQGGDLEQRLIDLFGDRPGPAGDRPGATHDRNPDGPNRDFSHFGEDGAGWAPREGVHDLLKTHEFTHDWFFG